MATKQEIIEILKMEAGRNLEVYLERSRNGREEWGQA